jgi:hypothetical protein
MLLTLEPLQAEEGDSLLLYWGSTADTRLAVIDGGPGNVYQNTLRPRLEEIRTRRGSGQLIIDLAMVSHVDNDHIVGVKKLFRQLRDEVTNNLAIERRPLSVKRLWHNTFNDVLGDAVDAYYKKLTASLASTSPGGGPNITMIERLADVFRAKESPDPGADATDIALVLAGHGEGRELRNSFDLLHSKGLIASLNAPFQDNGKPTLIMLDVSTEPVTITGLTFKVVGPMKAEIQALQRDFDKYIKEKGLVESSLLAAYADRSITNLSSIVCLVEMGGKRLLLTGDARGDKVIQGLATAGLLAEDPLEVNILKVPHHGSDRNVKPDFFNKILAETYVFSGNGKHGNPERDTLEWLIDARGKKDIYKIVLTYTVEEIDLERERHYVRHGKTWNREQHSLEVLFDKRQQEGFKFAVHAGGQIKIELGDEKVKW